MHEQQRFAVQTTIQHNGTVTLHVKKARHYLLVASLRGTVKSKCEPLLDGMYLSLYTLQSYAHTFFTCAHSH